MLAIIGGDGNLDCVKALISKGVNIKCKDDQGNTIFHLAALFNCDNTLEYLATNLKLELFNRNK